MESRTPNVIVFDLGGVLARICHSWQEAAIVAGVSCSIDQERLTPLPEFDGFDRYQAGQISLREYSEALGSYLGCSPEDAEKVHKSIIVEEYPGVGALIDELRNDGVRLGCLSNTNELHWEHLALNGRFPSINGLEMKMASHLVGLNKPDQAIFKLYGETFGVAPEEILFFDDHPGNVAGAQAAGWRAVQITPGEDTAAQMRRAISSTAQNDPVIA